MKKRLHAVRPDGADKEWLDGGPASSTERKRSEAQEHGSAGGKGRGGVESGTTGNETMDEDEEEARKSKGLPCGVKPSRKEVEDHERTHMPFRTWCSHCVRGRAKSHPHWRREKEDTGIPVISWDYMYMKDTDKEGNVQGETPILIWKDSNSKGSMAIVVPEKGACEYALRKGAQDMKRILGYNRMIFKGDQEPALRDLLERMRMLCGEQCMMEETPVGDSQSNGDVENAVMQVQGMFRTMRGDLESCYGRLV